MGRLRLLREELRDVSLEPGRGRGGRVAGVDVSLPVDEELWEAGGEEQARRGRGDGEDEQDGPEAQTISPGASRAAQGRDLGADLFKVPLHAREAEDARGRTLEEVEDLVLVVAVDVRPGGI